MATDKQSAGLTLRQELELAARQAQQYNPWPTTAESVAAALVRATVLRFITEICDRRNIP